MASVSVVFDVITKVLVLAFGDVEDDALVRRLALLLLVREQYTFRRSLRGHFFLVLGLFLLHAAEHGKQAALVFLVSRRGGTTFRAAF